MPSPYDYRAFFREEEDTTQREYWGNSAAGCIFVAKDTGRILLAHRSDRVDYEPETWGTWGGKIDMDESPKQAVEREVEEETGFTGQYKINPLYTYRDGTFQYYNYLVIVPFEFTPQLNWENNDSSWIEFGEWPSPLHFGMVELIKHAGGKIKKVIDLLKKRKDNMAESMDAPAIHQSSQDISSNFINYIKTVENGTTGKLPTKQLHIYDVAGEPHIGYGHKVKSTEMDKFGKGITQEYAEKLLVYDLLLAKKTVYKDIKSMFGVQVPLESYQEEMLTDYAFNLGTIKTFPKFTRAVLTKDWDTAKKEYIRTYKDKKGVKHELGRNKIFFDTYLKNLHTEKPKDAPKKAQKLNESVGSVNLIRRGIITEGMFGYELRSANSFLKYGYNPSHKVFNLNIVEGLPTDKNTKLIMEHFFQIVKQSGGALDLQHYSGEKFAYVKYMVEKLSKQYGIGMV
jgi:8-oxo-dGTP pyrophosphatase MutT (NUDIX family)/GH24 family phage-related lysozyme (muramidase)